MYDRLMCCRNRNMRAVVSFRKKDVATLTVIDFTIPEWSLERTWENPQGIVPPTTAE